MGYVCRECGNTDSFEAQQEVTNYDTQHVYMDGEGNINDWGDTETNDSDTGDMNDVECAECNSSNVLWEDDEDEIARITEAARAVEEAAEISNWQQRIERVSQ